MSKIPHLYRRDGGVYAVRFVVPESLRIAVGSREVHRSTACRDLALAKIVAAQYAAEWHRRLAQLRHMDPNKLIAGSVALLGDGDIPLLEAAAELGADPADLARRLRTQRARFFVANMGWKGWVVDDVGTIGVERDETMVVVSRDVSPQAFDQPGMDSRVTITQRMLQIYDPDEALAVACEPAPQTVCIFLIPPSRHMAFVVPLPGVELGIERLFVARAEVESLRRSLHSDMPVPVATSPQVPPMPDFDSIANGPYQRRLVSALTTEYLERQSPAWGLDEQRRQRDACSALVELTGDIPLGKITRDLVHEVGKRLSKIPGDRRRYWGAIGNRKDRWSALIEYAEEHELPLATPGAVRHLMEDVCAVFRWGHKQDWLRRDPTAELTNEIFERMGGEATSPESRRDMFSDEDLRRMFAMPWFRDGVGRRTARGRFHSYKPFYFWLPLLALYTGARINELSQLYLDDVRRDEGSGIWYVDFNLNAPDKLDADAADGVTGAKKETAVGQHHAAGAAFDKSLKTAAAVRVVPLHPRLIELGLAEYVEGLRVAGYPRLFPELAHDTVKGYGKAAGKWFNDALMKRDLGLERNGRKVFHSFRHNFSTALDRAGVPDKAIKQLMGHARADKAQAGATLGYQKLRTLSELAPYINGLTYDLPAIATFKIEEGLLAVRHALELKEQQPDRSRTSEHRAGE